MRRPLGVHVIAALLGVLLMAGCGQDDTGDVTESGPEQADTSGSPEPEDEDDEEPLGKVDFEMAEMVTETGVGGEVDAQAMPLGDIVAVQGFSTQFTDEAMKTRLTNILDSLKIPDGKALYAAVVAVGCDVPPGVVVTSTDSGLEIKAQPIPTPQKQCVAPMTSVALVLVDEDVVG